jgi:hypothetical protein
MLIPDINNIDIPIKAVEDEATYYIQLQYEVPDLLKQRNL